MNRPTNDVFLPLSWSSLSAETSRLHMLTHVPDPTCPQPTQAPPARPRSELVVNQLHGATCDRASQSGFSEGGWGTRVCGPWHRAVRLRERRSQRA